MNNIIRRSAQAAFVASVVLLSAPGTAAAQQTLGFDDVATNATGFNSAAFSAYGGYTFEGWGILNGAVANNAIGTGSNAVSGTKFAYGQAEGASFVYRADALAFDLVSGWLSFREFDLVSPLGTPVSINVLGYRTGDVLPSFSRSISLTNTATRFQFDFFGIEEVVFETEALQQNSRFNTLALDDVQLAVVPEPGSIVLLAIGLGGLLVVARRRYRTR